MNYNCEKFYTKTSTIMETTNIFPFLKICSIEFLLFWIYSA